MKINRAIYTVGLLACLSLMYSCGYTLRSGMLSGMRRIHLSGFENHTYEHSIEIDLERRLAREFIADGALAVADAQTSDVRMSGAVNEYILEPYAYGADESEVERYRMIIRARVLLEALPGGAMLWQEDAIEGEHIYHPEGMLAKTEEEARREALRDLARRIVLRTVGSW